ncbi:alpha/beta fold hydrolase [Litorivivens sp.]|uniref:alpha/beta fold hydrolase n=1 Tax=Litorivivens sp. TaxID=2020868 RepID=UPI003567719C
MRLLLGFIVVAALLVLPLLAPKLERNTALQEYREQVGAKTIQSKHGKTRYQTWGNPNNPTVILIHSFNGYLETWQPNVDALAAAGFHVVAYDLFGRGLSDRPLRPYTPPLFHEQLDSLRAELELTNPVHLVGSSFGCVLASDYAVKNPSAVSSLVLTGPAGWPDGQEKLQQLVKTPFAGEYVFYYAGKSILSSKISNYLLNREENDWAMAYWKVYGQFPGVTRAALSTLRHSPVLDNTRGWSALGKTSLPVMMIWGRQDSSFPYYNAKIAARQIPQAEIVGIDGAEHWVNIDQAEETNTAMIRFLQAQR